MLRAVVLGAALAATCGVSSSALAAGKGECHPAYKMTTVKVIYQPSGLSSYFYASAANLWQKFGVKIDPVKIEAGQSELGALANGSIDFAFLGGPPTLTAIGHKLPVKIIFSTNNVSHLEGLIVRPSSKIGNLHDLIGKTVASPTGSSAWVGMHLTLAHAGVPIDKVHVIDLSPAATLAAFTAGSIDAAWIWDTWIKRLESVGGKLVAVEHHYGVAEPNTWVVSDSFMKKHPDVVARFVAALNAGAEGANKDPKVAARQYSELTGVTAAQAVDIMKVESTFTISDALNPASRLSFVNAKTGLANTLAISGDVLKQAGILPGAPSRDEISSAIDLDAVKAARKLTPGCGS